MYKYFVLPETTTLNSPCTPLAVRLDGAAAAELVIPLITVLVIGYVALGPPPKTI